NFLPSPQQRWCTQKMKLAEMEKFVGDTPTISYVGIRGDEDREGYVSTKPNIQAIFPFRKNIWSIDVIHNVIHQNNIDRFTEIYLNLAPEELKHELKKILEHPLTKDFYYGKKANALMDLDVKLFNKAVFEFLKGTDYPVGKLDEFPLIDNDDILVRDDIFRILEDSGVGVPAYYKPIEFEVDGKVGTYNRSRSGCYFCFFQQKLEWIWLYEQHPDLFAKAMEFEKDGYTWNQNESLADLIKPERVRQIKLDAIKKQEAKRQKGSGKLVDLFGDPEEDNEAFCANCFI
nr:phosphoadenosine phosphosulfate reductase [Bacteroides sp.]